MEAKRKSLITGVIFTILIISSTAVSAWFLYSLSLRLDESQSLWVASKSIPELLKLVGQDIHVPLYYIILHFWVQIFGLNIIFARTLSLVFFILTLPVLYCLSKESGNQKIAWITVSLFSLSPFIMWYSLEARMYTLFTLVAVVNHYLFLNLARTRGKKYKLAYFMSSLLGMYTHYFFLFFLASQAIFVLINFLKNVQKGGWKYKKFPLTYFSLNVSAFIGLTPWIVHLFNLGLASNTQPLIPKPSSYNILQAFVNFIFGFQEQFLQSIIVSVWPMVLIVLFHIFSKERNIQIKNLPYFATMAFVPLFLVFIFSLIRPIFLSRYLIMITPSLFFLLGWIILDYSKRLFSLLTFSIIILMLGFLVRQNLSAQTPVKENYKGAGEYLNSHVTHKDIVTVYAPFTIYPVEYYYSGTARISTIPEWDRYVEGPIPEFTKEVLTNQIEKYKSSYQRLFILLSYDQGNSQLIKEYLDTNFERLSVEKFSPDLEVRVYKLPLAYRPDI